MSMFTIFLLLFLTIRNINSTKSQTSSWTNVRDELSTKQTSFNNNNFIEYVFSAQLSYCMCAPCSVAKKFITVSDDNVIDITFDSSDSNSDGCTENNLYDIDYRSINDWFVYAINYTEQYLHCDTSPTEPECGGDASLEVIYDTTYHFPTQMIFDEAAMAYDGGMGYTFACFTPFENGERVSVPSTFSSECDFNATFPQSSYWDTIQNELMAQRDIFESFDFSDYIYSAQRGPCECMPCSNAKKIITVSNYNVTEVIFDDDNSLQCTADDLYDADYRTMVDWFKEAITYTELYKHCENISSSANSWECTDKSLECTYDESYGYISEIVFDRDAMAYDGGAQWYFGDFDALVPTSTGSGSNSSSNSSSSSAYWETIRNELMEQRETFKSFNVGDYTYSLQRGSCECLPCSTAKKYVIVRDYNVSDVVFDDSFDCSSEYLYDTDYRTMMDWFNVAIEYTEEYEYCGDTSVSVTNGECADKSLECEYDEDYGYLTEIVFDRDAMAYDGGSQWYFECFKPHTNGIVSTRYDTESCEDAPLSDNAFVFAKWWISIMVVLYVVYTIN